MGYTRVITHLQTLDPNFQRDILVLQYQSQVGAPKMLNKDTRNLSFQQQIGPWKLGEFFDAPKKGEMGISDLPNHPIFSFRCKPCVV